MEATKMRLGRRCFYYGAICAVVGGLYGIVVLVRNVEDVDVYSRGVSTFMLYALMASAEFAAIGLYLGVMAAFGSHFFPGRRAFCRVFCLYCSRCMSRCGPYFHAQSEKQSQQRSPIPALVAFIVGPMMAAVLLGSIGLTLSEKKET